MRLYNYLDNYKTPFIIVYMRYLDPYIRNDLKKKMVFISGPRQIGKSTLAKIIVQDCGGTYLNYDVVTDRKLIVDETWDKSSPMVCLDEIHKNKKWKNLLKSIYDAHSKNQAILVTGSARLDLFRKSGDALTGRYFHYRMHPIDLMEGLKLGDFKDPQKLIDHLLGHGGFPESFFNPEISAKLSKNRIEQVLNEDVYDLSQMNNIKSLELLIEVLRETNGGSLNFDRLSKKVGTSPPTVKKWIELLEKLYLIFIVTPFASNVAKSFRKESKYYFFDLSLNLNEYSYGLENLVALSLLKQCDLLNDSEGKNYRLHYYKDSNKNEVDFVITLNRKPVHLIEVKKSDDNFSRSLIWLKEKNPLARATQVVHEFVGTKEKANVKMVNLSDFLLKPFF